MNMAHNDNTAKGTVTVQIQVDVQRMRDILTTAWETGIGYWLGDGDFSITDCYAERDEKNYVYAIHVLRSRGATIPKFRREVASGSRKAVLTDMDLACVIGPAILNKDTRHAAMAELTEGDYDAATADTLVQFALFGEVVYG
jgi:hypothetical protein